MSWNPGCRCEDCDTDHVIRFNSLSAPQQEAVDALDFAVPTHATALSRAGIRSNTLNSLDGRYVRRVSLYGEGSTVPIPFYTLTQKGDEMMRAVARREAAA